MHSTLLLVVRSPWHRLQFEMMNPSPTIRTSTEGQSYSDFSGPIKERTKRGGVVSSRGRRRGNKKPGQRNANKIIITRNCVFSVPIIWHRISRSAALVLDQQLLKRKLSQTDEPASHPLSIVPIKFRLKFGVEMSTKTHYPEKFRHKKI